jgi:hypothetical protein
MVPGEEVGKAKQAGVLERGKSRGFELRKP